MGGAFLRREEKDERKLVEVFFTWLKREVASATIGEKLIGGWFLPFVQISYE